MSFPININGKVTWRPLTRKVIDTKVIDTIDKSAVWQPRRVVVFFSGHRTAKSARDLDSPTGTRAFSPEPLRTILSQLRRQRGWSQAELARRAGMHPSTISFAESGRFRLSPTQIDKLSRALGVSSETFLETPDDGR